MTRSQPTSFHLRDDFQVELGWRDFVRYRTTTDPGCVTQILAYHRARSAMGPDPLTRLECWQPFLPGYMFYFWWTRAGDRAPSFVASDALFTMTITPLPDEDHIIGLPEDLLDVAHEALTPPGGAAPVPSPLLPRRPEGGPAARDLFPELLVVHRYPVARATLRPCAEILEALRCDPLGWWGRQPRLPGLWG